MPADLMPLASKLDTNLLVQAAEVHARRFAGDPRPCIKTDTINTFYAGAYWVERLLTGGGAVERRSPLRLILDVVDSGAYDEATKLERIEVIARTALEAIE